MFIHTLGYTTPKVVEIALTGSIMDNVATDRRGKHAPKHSMKEGDERYILNHILNFHPAVAHYRSEHAPLRRYLPSELTIREMYQDYIADCEEDGLKAFSYSVYQKKVHSLNISFAKLGVEQCEDCDEHLNHLKETAQTTDDVETQDPQDEHEDSSPSSPSEKKERKTLKKTAKRSKRKGDNVDKHASCSNEKCAVCDKYQKHRRY